MTGQELEKKVNISEAKAQIKLIEKYERLLARQFESISHGYYWKNYLDENIKGERLHDKGRPYNIKRFLTIKEAGKLFAVKQIFEYLYTEQKIDPKDYVSYRKEYFTAYSLAKTFDRELKEGCLSVLTGKELRTILNIDYAEIQQLSYND